MQRLKSFDRETSQGLFRRMSKEYEVLSQNICYTVEKKPLNITSWGRSLASTWRDKVSMYMEPCIYTLITKQTNRYWYMYTVLFLYIQYKYYHMDIYPRYKVYSCRTYKKSPWSTFVHQNQPTLESLSLFLSEVKSCDLKHLSSLTIRCTAFKRGRGIYNGYRKGKACI